jgi:Rv0078B-related antitoxin
MNSKIQSIEIVDDRVAEVLRKKTPAERLAIADGLWRFAREMIHDVIAQEHPDWAESEIQKQVARRLSHGAV